MLCTLPEHGRLGDGVSGSVVWERNGIEVPSSNTGELLISEVEFEDQGEYTCRVLVTPGSDLGPVSAGTLTVLGRCGSIT
jgi:hypothetical protein